jgi:outer membrane receptor protein involved in Fe transport
MNRKDIAARSTLALMLLAAVPRITAQTAAQPATAETDEEMIELSPFTVTADEDKGSYRATATLAGSRIRTELKDVASSISVITADFLRDTGAKSNQDLLVYTTGTEVGGVYGNYAGIGSAFIDGANEGNSLLRPAGNTRVRGLDSADNTRELFQTYIPWDGYNVGRVDLQRGPNSILFGFGSPSGIVNTSLNQATFGRTEGNVENRLGSFGSVRWSLDYNHVVLPRELSFRISALDDETKFRQDPAYNHDRRLFGSFRYSPKFFQKGSARTVIRGHYEHGEVDANRPRILPPSDRINPFFDMSATGVKKQTWDPYYAWAAGIFPLQQNTLKPGEQRMFWMVQYPGPGIQATSNPMFIYDSPSASNQAYARQAGPVTQADGFPFASNIGIGSYREFAIWANTFNPGSYPAADKGFYKERSLTDPSIFNFYDQLIDGPNKREWQNWDAYNLTVEQTFFDNRLGIEVVYDRQKYDDGQTRNVANPFISVDIREYLLALPSVYGSAPGVTKNPYAGRAFVGGSGRAGNTASIIDQKNIRATVFGDIRASDFIDNSRLARILGRHVVTGVYTKEKVDQEDRNWARYATTAAYSEAIGKGPSGSNEGGLTHGDVVADTMTYLSGDLRSRNTAAGLNLGRITAVQSPSGNTLMPYWSEQWIATGVNPTAPWFNPARDLFNTPPGVMSTESENPLNYRGWTNGNFDMLNADRGDINKLYTDVSAVERVTQSKAFTWQAYLWDDTLVGTYGWRTDKRETRSGASSSQTEPGKVARLNPELGDLDPTWGVSKGDSTSWGLVLHTPKPWRNKLPLGANISLAYSDGRNSRVQTRYGFSGRLLPNASGRTKDASIVVSLLDDRLQFKVTKYKTTVRDADLSTVSSETTTLGNNTYYLRNLEAWGTATVMTYLRAREGQYPADSWFWNWALVDSGWDGQYENALGDAFKNHPSTAKQKAAIDSWLAQMPSQEWFAAYGFNINYAAAKAGDWRNAFPGWTPSAAIGGVQPAGGGRINGTWPTGTADNLSEGYEYELTGQITKNWNLTMNASKTHASQTALGADLVSFIEAQYAKYQSPAGDLRLWWGGGDAFRKTYNENIWSAYQFQLQTNGKMASELSPWRFNMITNYSFDRGALKGVNAGLAYRWEDRRVIGYKLNAKKDNLDVNAPYWSDTEDHIDLWVGYQRKLSKKLTWRVQLNLRNVGEDVHLVPFSVQPDGSPAAFRIQEGMTWQLTNTLSF